MDAIKILQSDLLEIVFEGRNKEYGAYALRKQYPERLMMAMGITMLFVLLATLISFSKKDHPDKRPTVVTSIVELVAVPRDEKILPPPEPPSPPPPAQEIATIRHTLPIIVDMYDVAPEDMPPGMEDLETTLLQHLPNGVMMISAWLLLLLLMQRTRASLKGPPSPSDKDKVFIDVQIPSEYPG
jgi:protein TonB